MQGVSRKERERLMREDEILDAAEKIFGGKGFEGALMDDIAREAQFTRKTLYQYFGNKEELLSAVILRGFKLLLAYSRESVDERASGFERLRAMGMAYYRFYRERTDFFGLINHSSRMKSMGGEARRREFDETDRALFQIIAGAIDAGKADGSIRPDVDTVMATASVVFAITGFFMEFSLTGKSFTEHLSLDRDAFAQYTLDLMLDAFRPRA